MTRHVTAGRLVESAIKAVTEELCGEENDRKAVFRALRYARVHLHVLCGHISKEETPESDT